MRFNILFGGEAGQGPNILAEIVSEGLISKGYYVFYSREYQSVIRGGHNFNIVSFSENQINSNSKGIDILVCLDENTEKIHKSNLKKNSITLKEKHSNMFFAGVLYKLFGIEFRVLERSLENLKKFDENIREARKGYNSETRKLDIPIAGTKHLNFLTGNNSIAKSAVNSGIQYYYSYPMTPATPVMADLAQMQLLKENKHKVIELENEIAVINAALGSSLIGSRAMVGTSGGGFDLMTEALSMSGMAEIPIVIYLASRPGPSTGLATYTGQSDLNVTLYAGHGEFSRILIAPGDAKESAEAVNQAIYLSQKFRVPALVLSDKHLAESKYSFDSEPKFIEIKNSIISPERFNSYEHDKNGIATEDAKIIIDNFKRRLKKEKEIVKESNKFEMFKIHGKKESQNLILSWGSPKGAILDAICENNIDAKFLQIIYLEPFSEKISEELKKAKRIIIIENNATSPLSQIIAQKTGVFIEAKNKILRYDGRPFLSDELAEEIARRIK